MKQCSTSLKLLPGVLTTTNVDPLDRSYAAGRERRPGFCCSLCATQQNCAESRATTRLGAGPRGRLAHAQHRLVLDAIQPTDRQPRAADPSHHGDVAVSEEAMQKMRHGERRWGRGGRSRGRDDVRESVLGGWPLGFCRGSRRIYIYKQARGVTSLGGSRGASFPECELDRIDSPPTGGRMGCWSQPAVTFTEKQRDK